MSVPTCRKYKILRRRKEQLTSSVFSCDLCKDGCENETCHEDHVRKVDEKRKDLEKIINEYEKLVETYDDTTVIDQEEVERICQRYEF